MLLTYSWNAKGPIFLGNFTCTTSNYCLKNRALGFPGGFYNQQKRQITDRHDLTVTPCGRQRKKAAPALSTGPKRDSRVMKARLRKQPLGKGVFSTRFPRETHPITPNNLYLHEWLIITVNVGKCTMVWDWYGDEFRFSCSNNEITMSIKSCIIFLRNPLTIATLGCSLFCWTVDHYL